MKKIVISLILLGLVNVASAVYVETFDSNNADWNYGYGTNWVSPMLDATYVGTGGNPDGHISGLSQNLYAIWTFEAAVYGDMTGLTLTIDTKITDCEAGTAQFYVGREGTFYVDGTWDISLDTNWTTHQTVLDSANFTLWTQGGAGSESLAYVLAAPDDIGVFFGGSLVSGTGAVLVDNYGTIPEPATISLLGLGAFGLLRKRRG